MEDITTDELRQRQQASEKLDIIDVREVWEHQENNIGGLNIPMATIPSRLDELESLRDREVIIYCRTGNRSGKVKKFLEQQGFMQVRNLLGGIEEFLISDR